MYRTFVIDGERIKMEVIALSSTSRLLSVTPVGGAWVERVSTGQTTAYLMGLLPNGTVIDDTFVVIERQKDGTLVLASNPYLSTVG